MKMTKWIAIVAVGMIAVGCGTAPIKPTSTPTAKPAPQATAPAPTPPPAPAEQPPADPWTYYDNAKWSDDYNGLKLEIEKAAVTDAMPKLPDDQTPGDTSSVVGVKFKMINTTDKTFTFYPDQAKLVTSTGEQIDMPDPLGTTHIGGEIDGGVTKEGDIMWLLQRGHAEDAKWITVSFMGYTGTLGDGTIPKPKEYKVKLTLQ